jgi:hypothetical protein
MIERAEQTMNDLADPDGRLLYRAGGVSALVIGIAYLVIIALYIPIGAPPSGAEARLVYLAANTRMWWAILSLSVLTDVLFIPVGLALYLALKGINKSAMLLATACVGMFVVLDLAITWTNYDALITLSAKYAAASNYAEKAATVAAAIYPSEVLESRLLFVYNSLTLSAGILMSGFVMLKGIFSRSTAYLGLVTGILGIISVFGPFLIPALSLTIVVTSLLTTVWVLLVGHGLYRLGQT